METIPIFIKIKNNVKVMGYYNSMFKIIANYVGEMGNHLFLENLVKVTIHEIIHWQMDLSNEDYENEDFVYLAEQKIMCWLRVENIGSIKLER